MYLKVIKLRYFFLIKKKNNKNWCSYFVECCCGILRWLNQPHPVPLVSAQWVTLVLRGSTRWDWSCFSPLRCRQQLRSKFALWFTYRSVFSCSAGTYCTLCFQPLPQRALKLLCLPSSPLCLSRGCVLAEGAASMTPGSNLAVLFLMPRSLRWWGHVSACYLGISAQICFRSLHLVFAAFPISNRNKRSRPWQKHWQDFSVTYTAGKVIYISHLD